VIDVLAAYIPIDRRHALARRAGLPERTQGAALFADTSGFTPLTEALVRELGPQRGAEAITRQMNRIYAGLIAEIERYGGSVIGFAGDAITCWFDGDTGLRATACALRMQEAMAQLATVELPSGVMTMALKIAVSAGPACRFVVGDPAIQLHDVLAGATVARLAGGEQLARSGEVIVSAEVVAALGPGVGLGWRADPASGGRYAVISELAQAAETRPWPTLAPGALDEPTVRPWILPPVRARLLATQTSFLAELRPCVALFVRFLGIDYDGDPAAGLRLDSYIRWTQRVLARYDGFLIDITIGDKGSFLYASFGAPLAHDDDALRAVAAALELRRPPDAGQFITSVQIGLSQGRMWAGPYGGSTRRTYGVLGQEVNLAARLMMKAPPGQVLISPRLAAAVGRHYQLQALGPVPIKGLQQPLAVSQVLGPREAASRAGAPASGALVGRTEELALLDRALSQARAGVGQLLTIEGPAGIGKSYLTAAFAARAVEQGLRVAAAECQAVERHSAHAAWRQLVRALLGEVGALGAPGDAPAATQLAALEAYLRALNPDWLLRLPLLGEMLGLPIPDNPTTAALEPRLRQEALNGLIIDLLGAWSSQRPLLLLIDDAHWMDEPSQRLTATLARVIDQCPLLLALAQRPAAGAESLWAAEPDLAAAPTQLVLGEIGRDAVGTLLERQLGGPPKPLARELVEALAQGNPYFVEELARGLQEQGALVPAAGGGWELGPDIVSGLQRMGCLGWDAQRGGWRLAGDTRLPAINLGLPDSIHKVVLARMDRLPEAPKLTLKVASIIGRVFQRSLLTQTHPLSPSEPALQEQIALLEAREFTRQLAPPPQPLDSFRHSIAQEVSYETLLEVQRRELHERAGLALETLQPDAVEALAYHFQRGGLREKALEYLGRAARKAQREYANETALGYYEEALALEQHWRWHLGRAEVLHLLGRREQELDALRALDAFADAPALAAALLWSQYHESVGDYPSAATAAARALDRCRADGDTLGQARCLAQLGLIARRQGDYGGARGWYEQALLLSDADTLPSGEIARVLAQVLQELGVVSYHQGDYDEAHTYYERALGLSVLADNRKGEADALNSLGALEDTRQNLAEALVYYNKALELRRAIGDRSGEGGVLLNLAILHCSRGDYGQARADAQRALAIQQETGNRWEEVNTWNSLGIMYQELGDLGQARACLQRGLALSQAIGDEAGRSYLLANLGLVLRDQGDLAEATEQLSAGLALARSQNDPDQVAGFLNYLSTASLEAGRHQQAIEQASEALAIRQKLGLLAGTTQSLATLAATNARLGRSDIARDFAQQTLALLDQYAGEGLETPQRDYFVCYQVLVQLGAGSARAALESAYRLVMERANTITDPELRGSYLQQVTINRQIIAAARAQGLSD
jgi:adenylate cyclase